MVGRRLGLVSLLSMALLACPSKEGPEGPAGPAGPAGATGPAGSTGPQGARGPAGDAGVQGQTGGVGPQGPQGVAGQVQVVLTADGGTLTVDGGLAIVTGPAGASVTLAAESSGSNCAAGGIAVSQGGLTTYVCNGLRGDAGQQGPQGTQGVQGFQGVPGPRLVLLGGDGGVVGPMTSGGLTLLAGADCAATVIDNDLFAIADIAYYAQAACAGAAYAYGVGNGCVAGSATVTYRRVTPMIAVSVTPLSYFSNGACSPFTGGGSYAMLPLVQVGLPNVAGPFSIVMQ
jgi:Collagen triple helix repeat (20 copies)